MKIWEYHPKLTHAIKKSHADAGGRFYGHDFDHALRVAHYATLIAPDENTANLAGIAGLCHNADRILQHLTGGDGYTYIPEEKIISLTTTWLNTEKDIVNDEEREIIIDALLKHSNKNSSDDSLVLITLMDADRIVNLEADIIPREGHFFLNLPIVDPDKLLDDPEASYLNPKSIIRHIQELLDWGIEGGPVGIRLPQAMHIAKPRIDFLKLFLKTVIDQRKESGLIPYPDLT